VKDPPRFTSMLVSGYLSLVLVFVYVIFVFIYDFYHLVSMYYVFYFNYTLTLLQISLPFVFFVLFVSLFCDDHLFGGRR